MIKIRFEYRPEHRLLQIQLFGFVKNGSKVLWQTGATESKSGFKIVRRDVQLRIFAKDLHHFMAINAHAFTEISDLIRKTYFKRVKGVGGVFDQLSYWNGGPFHGCFYARIQSGNSFRGTIVTGPDDRKRRMIKIMNRRGFAHELGIHADAEVLSILFTRLLLEQRPHHIVHRSR